VGFYFEGTMKKHHTDSKGRSYVLEAGEARWPLKRSYCVSERYVFLAVARVLGLNGQWMDGAYRALDRMTPEAALALMVAGVQGGRGLDRPSASKLVQRSVDRVLARSAKATPNTVSGRTARDIERAQRKAGVRSRRHHRG
jgi:hypothetical protein